MIPTFHSPAFKLTEAPVSKPQVRGWKDRKKRQPEGFLCFIFQSLNQLKCVELAGESVFSLTKWRF